MTQKSTVCVCADRVIPLWLKAAAAALAVRENPAKGLEVLRMIGDVSQDAGEELQGAGLSCVDGIYVKAALEKKKATLLGRSRV